MWIFWLILIFYCKLIFCIPYETFQPAWEKLLAQQQNSKDRRGFSKDLNLYAGALPAYSTPYKPTNSYPTSSTNTSYSLIPGITIVDSDVKCGQDNRNFCNYPELPFVETLNIPQLFSGPNRLGRIPSGRCPDGYKKYPTKDCINVAAAVIETTCCVYGATTVSNLADYCNNRQGILFTATFELCDGRIFIAAGSNAWQIDENFKILGGPYSLSILTGGTVSSSVDSALVDSSCNVGFFQGTSLKWMNFPGKSASTDTTLSTLLGTIPTNLCGGSSCSASSVNFAVCPNNGFCMVSVNLTTTAGVVYKQLFLLAPGFDSYISSSLTPPGIAVTNNQDLKSLYGKFFTATFLRSTNKLAFTDVNNNVYFFDTTGKRVAPTDTTNLFDLFGICPGSSKTAPYTLYIPYPVYGVNISNAYPQIQLPVYTQLPSNYNNPYQVNSVQPVYAPAPQTYSEYPASSPSYGQPAPSSQYTAPSPPYQATSSSSPNYGPAYQPAPPYQSQYSKYMPSTTYAPPVQSYQPATPAPYNNPAPQSYETPQASYPQPSPSYQPQYQQPTTTTYAPPVQQYQPATPAPYTNPSPPSYNPAPQPPYPQPTPAPYQQQPQQYQPSPPAYNPAPQPYVQPTQAPQPYAPPTPAPPTYNSYVQPTPAPTYNAPAAVYNPAPQPNYGSYNQPTPAPVYNPPVYTPAPQPVYSPQPIYVQPTPAPSYPAPSYNQPTPAPTYNPSPSYNPAPQPSYDSYNKPTPAPSYNSYTPAPPVYQVTPAPSYTPPSYQQPQYDSYAPATPSYSPYAATPAPPAQGSYQVPFNTVYNKPLIYTGVPADLPMYIPSVPSYTPAPPSYAPAPNSYAPAPPAYAPAPPSYTPAATVNYPTLTTTTTTKASVKDSGIAPSVVVDAPQKPFKPSFKPNKEFFDLSDFIRNGGDTDEFFLSDTITDKFSDDHRSH